MIDILKECKDIKTIGITGHIRPDGDCIGSCCALYRYLKKNCPQIEVRLFLEEPPRVFQEITEGCQIESQSDDTVFDVFFVLDSVPERVGFSESYFKKAKKTINIDHHISNNGNISDLEYIIPNASSTSELVYDLLDQEKIDIEIAKAIYIGIAHDTGVFRYSNTAPKTLWIVSDLLKYEFDFTNLIDTTFFQKTYIQNQILGRALLESIVFMDGKCIVGMIDRKMMHFYGATSKDFEGIVNQLLSSKGVEVAIFMYEIDTLHFKISLRSVSDVDVSIVAQYFGGGGHKKAAGCDMNGTFHDVVNNLSKQIEKQMQEKSSDKRSS